MKSNILIILYALSVVLAFPLATPLQASNLKQAVGPRDGITPDQPWQVPVAGASNKARVVSPRQTPDDENIDQTQNNIDQTQSNIDQTQNNIDQTQSNNVLLAGALGFPGEVPTYRVWTVESQLSLEQTQFINTMIQYFGESGPSTTDQASRIKEAMSGTAGRNALSVDELQEAVASLLSNEWAQCAQRFAVQVYAGISNLNKWWQQL